MSNEKKLTENKMCLFDNATKGLDFKQVVEIAFKLDEMSGFNQTESSIDFLLNFIDENCVYDETIDKFCFTKNITYLN